MIAISQPCRFSVRYFAQFPGNTAVNDAFFPNKNTNFKTAILRFHEDFVSMKSIESFGGILTNCKSKSLA